MREFWTRPRGTPEAEAQLGEVASGIAGLGIMAVGVRRVFELELDEPARLLGFAVAVMVGLSIMAIGLLGSIKIRLGARTPQA